MVLPRLSVVSLGHYKTDPKLREVPMQHKRCWQSTVMNWRVIFSCDPCSVAGALPRRARPRELQMRAQGGRDGRGKGVGLH